MSLQGLEILAVSGDGGGCGGKEVNEFDVFR